VKIVNILIIAIIALLSIAAGLAKVMQTQQELEFLQGVGLSSALIVAFGLVQISGGVLLVLKKTRMLGAVLATSALVVSTVLIFIGGNLAFGLVSILPIALACVIIYQSARTTHNKSLNTDASDAGQVISNVMRREGKK
jgi:hypothetical protein